MKPFVLAELGVGVQVLLYDVQKAVIVSQKLGLLVGVHGSPGVSS